MDFLISTGISESTSKYTCSRNPARADIQLFQFCVGNHARFWTWQTAHFNRHD